jgi:hypothetical protein
MPLQEKNRTAIDGLCPAADSSHQMEVNNIAQVQATVKTDKMKYGDVTS